MSHERADDAHVAVDHDLCRPPPPGNPPTPPAGLDRSFSCVHACFCPHVTRFPPGPCRLRGPFYRRLTPVVRAGSTRRRPPLWIPPKTLVHPCFVAGAKSNKTAHGPAQHAAVDGRTAKDLLAILAQEGADLRSVDERPAALLALLVVGLGIGLATARPTGCEPAMSSPSSLQEIS